MSGSSIAALCSFILPGAGQLYNGQYWRALFWLIITPGLWIGTGGLLGWLCHVLSAWTAWSQAEIIARQLASGAHDDGSPPI